MLKQTMMMVQEKNHTPFLVTVSYPLLWIPYIDGTSTLVTTTTYKLIIPIQHHVVYLLVITYQKRKTTLTRAWNQYFKIKSARVKKKGKRVQIVHHVHQIRLSNHGRHHLNPLYFHPVILRIKSISRNGDISIKFN